MDVLPVWFASEGLQNGGDIRSWRFDREEVQEAEYMDEWARVAQQNALRKGATKEPESRESWAGS